MKSAVTLIDYGIGNLASVANMIRKVGGKAEITGDPARIRNAERILLPGVGAFDACRNALDAHDGIEDAIREHVTAERPLLGICVGMQLLADGSEEGERPGLGLVPGIVRRFDFADRPDSARLRVPHMGWSIVEPRGRSDLFAPFSSDPARFYFVHSYHFVCSTRADVAGEANYGGMFTAAVQRGNVVGVQFHPEKSHSFGMRLIKRFLDFS